jgi:hypothetical protein
MRLFNLRLADCAARQGGAAECRVALYHAELRRIGVRRVCLVVCGWLGGLDAAYSKNRANRQFLPSNQNPAKINKYELGTVLAVVFSQNRFCLFAKCHVLCHAL